MNAPHHHNPAKGITLALAGFSLFSCGDAIVKHLSGGYGPFTICFIALSINVVCYAAISPFMGGLRRAFAAPDLKWHLLRGLIMVMQIATMIYAFAHMSMAKTYALAFSAPFILAIIGLLLLKEKATARQWTTIAAGFCGVLVVLRPGLIPIDAPSLAALASAVGYSFSYTIARKYGRTGDSVLTLGVAPVTSALIATLPLYAAHFEWPRAADIPWFVLMGVLSTAGFLWLSTAFLHAPAAAIAPFHYVQMLWALLFGWLFFGDGVDFYTGLGATIIIVSGLWLIRQGMAKSAAAVVDSPALPDSY
jgi:S-adenosylmethionine uptake transporter